MKWRVGISAGVIRVTIFSSIERQPILSVSAATKIERNTEIYMHNIINLCELRSSAHGFDE